MHDRAIEPAPSSRPCCCGGYRGSRRRWPEEKLRPSSVFAMLYRGGLWLLFSVPGEPHVLDRTLPGPGGHDRISLRVDDRPPRSGSGVGRGAIRHRERCTEGRSTAASGRPPEPMRGCSVGRDARFATSGVLLRTDGEDGRHVHARRRSASRSRAAPRTQAANCWRWRHSTHPEAARRPSTITRHERETFTGVSGTVTARIGGVERRIGPGEMVTIRAGTRHAFWNPGTETATIKWEVRPALSTERMFEELSNAGSDVQTGAGDLALQARVPAQQRAAADAARRNRPDRPARRPLARSSQTANHRVSLVARYR